MVEGESWGGEEMFATDPLGLSCRVSRLLGQGLLKTGPIASDDGKEKQFLRSSINHIGAVILGFP